MREHLYQPQKLKPSGNGFLRFPIHKEAGGKASGFVKLFPEGDAAIFGDFKSGQQYVWHAKDPKSMDPHAFAVYRAQMDKAHQEAREERERSHALASGKAATIYGRAKEAKPDHPYLLKKAIRSHGPVRQAGTQLVVPVNVRGNLSSLQFIAEDGTKQFLAGGEVAGGYCLLGTSGTTICICEGYATGYSIHEATGHQVAVAFNAGNLMAVAQAVQQQYKEATIILCADNDQWTVGNPGLTKATEAARVVGGMLAVPEFLACDVSGRPTDFNDLHRLAGRQAVNQAVAEAKKVEVGRLVSSLPAAFDSKAVQECIAVSNGASYTIVSNGTSHICSPASDRPHEDGRSTTKPVGAGVDGNMATVTSIERGISVRATKDAPRQPVDLDAPSAPPRMAAAGFPSLFREIVDAACAHSEAHEVAVAVNCLVYFSATMGRSVFQRIGDTNIHCRPFALIVGKSGKARKGTAEATVRQIFQRTDTMISKSRGIEERLRCHAGGLSTGEGIAWAIRDPSQADDKGKGGDPGVTDKRLLVIESEFDNVLSQLRRDSNTLSASVRNLFDGRDLEPLTKTSPTRASKPHVNIIGHITAHELREKSTATDVANGLLNRFMMFNVYRPKLDPFPQPTPPEILELLAGRVAEAIMAVTGGDLHGNDVHEVTFSDAARQLWVEHYPSITQDREGKAGSLLARSEMYARMLAMIFAAMDRRLIIEPGDLNAAIAWVEYWNASITYIFNCKDDEEGLDPFAREVLEIIKAEPGITLSHLNERWTNKRIREVKAALDVLLNVAPPLVEQRKVPTAGRPSKTYHAYEKK